MLPTEVETRIAPVMLLTLMPPLALSLIGQGGAQDLVFAGKAGKLAGFSKLKARLDRISGVTDWRLHDLRRTARSLMSRAGVSSDHAERCLGHIMSGVRGVYDRHQYRREKLHAFEALASLIESIVSPTPNVTPLPRKA